MPTVMRRCEMWHRKAKEMKLRSKAIRLLEILKMKGVRAGMEERMGDERRYCHVPLISYTSMHSIQGKLYMASYYLHEWFYKNNESKNKCVRHLAIFIPLADFLEQWNLSNPAQW